MEPDLMLTAVLIGFGFGNTFLCTLVAFNTTIGRRKGTCAAFLGGRLTGVMFLGMIIALYGWYVEPDARVMILIFAFLSLAFGALVIVYPKGLTRFKLLKNCEINGCETCDSAHGEEMDMAQERAGDGSGHGHGSRDGHGDPLLPEKNHSCSTCSHSASCASKDGPSTQYKPETTGDPRKTDDNYRGLDLHSIFLLGSVRGATPCMKIMILVPLILTLPFGDSMALVAIYALSSSIYTVIGVLLGSSLGAGVSRDWRPHLTRAGAMMMIGIGVYYLYKYWIYECQGGF